MHVWTINEPAEMERLLDLGVDGVMSDFPGRLAEVVAAGFRRVAVCAGVLGTDDPRAAAAAMKAALRESAADVR